MPKFHLGRYTDVWAQHPKVQGDSQAYRAALAEVYTEDATYTDVPSGHQFAGHSGLEEMSRHISSTYDVDIVVLSAVADEAHFAIEFESVIRRPGGEVKFNGVAAGDLRDGKVSAHRDYYDRSGFGAPAGGA